MVACLNLRDILPYEKRGVKSEKKNYIGKFSVLTPLFSWGKILVKFKQTSILPDFDFLIFTLDKKVPCAQCKV